MIDFFRQEKVSERILRIVDIAGTAAYLIQGTEKACLIDTCNGFGNIKKYVESICKLPLTVVLTHGHFDHAGAAALFDEVYMNPRELDVYRAYYRHPMKEEELLRLETRYGHLEENPLRTAAFLPLEDGDLFELGGVSVEMIACAGHTPGMMMAYIKEERTMLFGDACGEGTLLFDDFALNISAYRKNLQRIKDTYEAGYDRIIRNHGSFTSPLNLLDNVIECCDTICAGKDDHQPRPGSLDLFYAKAVNERNERVDGGHGNICYRIDKV